MSATFEQGYAHNASSPPAAAQGGSHKRIILCCDGTWQDGLETRQKWKYTNVLRLARSINHVDERFDPPIHQVVFYQNGIGTDNIYDKIVGGLTGATLAEKVEEAYGFIAHNYRPGDEIFLFGFSRGAYTARMVGMFIGAIGVLDRTQMDHFASIFLLYQKRGKAESEDEKRQLDEELEPWTGTNGPGQKRVSNIEEAGQFSVKVIGVFDTVGSVGMPEELSLSSEKLKNIFGFPDKHLGHHIERAYQALALNEDRVDFNCAKFEQTADGRRKGQLLKQCWFTGTHCDIGGGFKEHDLSDLSLNWMIANINDVLSMDTDYSCSLLQPQKPWGTLPPHSVLTGIYTLAKRQSREVPTDTDLVTHEYYHSSVLEQADLDPKIADTLKNKPYLVDQLLPWELEIKEMWADMLQTSGSAANRTMEEESLVSYVAALDESDPRAEHLNGWFNKLITKSSIGVLVKELLVFE
ncbi:hypothetical protein C8Q80DRAFT_1131135 [Daedaleopsis nitida]|nr:hypothetical protein C8Q80DRAFT_1131135 [Daedaleopsis nitida]